MNKESVRRFFTRLAAATPQPRTELNYTNPYTLLVAVTLSAQSTDRGVNRATESLFKKVSHPKDIVRLGENGLKPYIKTIGFYNTKARNIVAAAKLLIDRHGGEVPHTRAELEALPGVGQKTASVILNEIFKEGTIAVDTHVFRVANRTGLAKAKTPNEMEAKLLKIVPKKFLLPAHHLLILHGRYVCVARKPKCPACVVRDICEYRDKTPDSAVVTKSKPR